MEKIATKEETEAAKELLKFYTDMVENNNSNIQYNLAEHVVLDWFGRTVKDRKKVISFIKETVAKVTHHITNSFPSENVQFRDTHRVKVVPTQEIDFMLPKNPANDFTTPPRQIQPSTSTPPEQGQGDGLHNILVSPKKKMKLSVKEDSETVEAENVESSTMKYLTAEGSVEFHRPSNKKLQSECKWKRPMKLHLGYTETSLEYFTIYLIIYEGNLKCRRNLLKEFSDVETSATKNN